MEKRSIPRRRVFKAGTIEFNGGAFSCFVKNRSKSGAMLDVPSTIGIPDSFMLVEENSRVLCRVIWRKAKHIGVEFV